MQNDIQQKYQLLQSTLAGYGRICVAYSGGVDSTFLLYAAIRAVGAENVLAVMAEGAFMMQRERQFALETAQTLGVRPVTFEAHEFDIPQFVENRPERCYYCKKNVFLPILAFAKQHGCAVVADGSNTDDAGDYRPGRRALAELGVVSPLEQAGLSKQDIRGLSREAGLPTADYPSRACLASRIPYGTAITPELLQTVEYAEDCLIDLGFYEVRVRYHGAVCIIEVPPAEFERLLRYRARITTYFKTLGFQYITLDMQGIRTGSMNEVL